MTIEDGFRDQTAQVMAELRADIRALDSARSLGDVLRTLLQRARGHVDRASLFLSRNGRMHAWANDGFDPLETPASAVSAFPLTVGGRVVAILYADATSSAKPWPAMLEVLTRHAARLLESMTLHKAVGLVPPRDAVVSGGAAAR